MEQKIFNFIMAKGGYTRGFALNIISQAKLETGAFTSQVYRDYNNLFGYGYTGSKHQSSKSRPVTKAGEPSAWAVYDSWQNSVNEILDYWARRKNEGRFENYADLEDSEFYVQILKLKGYFSSSYESYLHGVENYYDKLANLDLKVTKNDYYGAIVFIFVVAISYMLKMGGKNKSYKLLN